MRMNKPSAEIAILDAAQGAESPSGNGGVSGYARARAEGLDLECKVGLFERTERVVVTILGLLIGRRALIGAVLVLLSLLVPSEEARHFAPGAIRHFLDNLAVSINEVLPVVQGWVSEDPADVKRRMIEWFGPVLIEAYGGTERTGGHIVQLRCECLGQNDPPRHTWMTLTTTAARPGHLSRLRAW